MTNVSYISITVGFCPYQYYRKRIVQRRKTNDVYSRAPCISICECRTYSCMQRMDSFTRCGDIRRSSASPRPHCVGTPSASVWPSPRQTPGLLWPYPSDRTPLDASMKPVGALSAWSKHSDLVSTRFPYPTSPWFNNVPRTISNVSYPTKVGQI